MLNQFFSLGQYLHSHSFKGVLIKPVPSLLENKEVLLSLLSSSVHSLKCLLLVAIVEKVKETEFSGMVLLCWGYIRMVLVLIAKIYYRDC